MAEHKGIDSLVSNSDKGIKSAHLGDGAKKDGESPRHNEETHGTSDDINVNTPVDQVKGPGVFQRAKEEVEALVDAVVHPKK